MILKKTSLLFHLIRRYTPNDGIDESDVNTVCKLALKVSRALLFIAMIVVVGVLLGYFAFATCMETYLLFTTSISLGSLNNLLFALALVLFVGAFFIVKGLLKLQDEYSFDYLKRKIYKLIGKEVKCDYSPKQPGFLKTLYLSIKEKTCFIVKLED